MPLKKEFLKDKDLCKVTFYIESKNCVNFSKVNLVGDFNSWSSSETPLIKQSDGSFAVTIELLVGREFQFRYLIDGEKWENDCKADKYCPAPIGNVDNSIVVTNRE